MLFLWHIRHLFLKMVLYNDPSKSKYYPIISHSCPPLGLILSVAYRDLTCLWPQRTAVVTSSSISVQLFSVPVQMHRQETMLLSGIRNVVVHTLWALSRVEYNAQHGIIWTSAFSWVTIGHLPCILAVISSEQIVSRVKLIQLLKVCPCSLVSQAFLRVVSYPHTTACPFTLSLPTAASYPGVS